MCVCMLSSFSCVWLFATIWTVACQAPLPMGFSRQEYWSGLPCPPPGNLPDPGIKPQSVISPALEGRFYTISATWEAQKNGIDNLICKVETETQIWRTNIWITRWGREGGMNWDIGIDIYTLLMNKINN